MNENNLFKMFFLGDTSNNISNTKGAIIFKVSEQFTCFTVMTFVPRFTALAGARIYVTIITVDIWAGY